MHTGLKAAATCASRLAAHDVQLDVLTRTADYQPDTRLGPGPRYHPVVYLTQRLVVRGRRHQNGTSRFFRALATRNGEDLR